MALLSLAQDTLSKYWNHISVFKKEFVNFSAAAMLMSHLKTQHSININRLPGARIHQSP